jgi:hypothetical protein
MSPITGEGDIQFVSPSLDLGYQFNFCEPDPGMELSASRKGFKLPIINIPDALHLI